MPPDGGESRIPWREHYGDWQSVAWQIGDFALGLLQFVVLPVAAILLPGWGLWFLITGHA